MSETFLGANQFSNEPRGQHGDLFPMPLPVDHGFPGEVGGISSRRARQRVQKRRLLLLREAETVRALNNLAGFKDEGRWPAFAVNHVQEAVLRRVHKAHLHRPPPVEQQSGQAALRQLLKSKAPGGYQLEPIGAGSLASYVPEKLSLPRGQGKPVDLKTILPPREKRQLENFKTEMLLSPEEMAGVQERGFHGDCYLDPQLQHNPDLYHRFVADLEMSNLLAYTTTPRVQIGAFMVNKKNNKQRLVIDARRANRLFRSPPTTVLGSVEAWSRLEVQDHQDVFMAQEDVKDFFYRLSIDRDLSEFSVYPPLTPTS